MNKFTGLALFAALAAAVPAAAQNASLSQAGAMASGKTAAVPMVTAPSLSNANSNNPLLSGAKSKWTVMVFVNGKNNLEDSAIFNLHQMEQVGSSGDLKIVAEIGRMDWVDGDDTWTAGTRDSYKGKDRTLAKDPSVAASTQTWAGSRRILVLKNTGDQTKIASMVLGTKKNTDMGSWQNMVDFVKWAKGKFPAEHYLLIIWNHGSGWQSVGKLLTDNVDGQQTSTPDYNLKGISYDDQSNNSITTVEMGVMMSKLGQIDVYGSDACLMADAGVDAEIYKSAGYIVGSEETEPGDGYDYSFLQDISANPSIAPMDVAKSIVQHYQSYYDKNNEGSVTQSAIAASGVPGLARVLDTFAKAALASTDMPAIQAAAAAAEKFDNPGDHDMYDFMSRVAASAKDPNVQASANAAMTYVGNLVFANASTGEHKGGAHGISVYTPTTSETYDTSFNAIQLSKGTAWAKLCQAMAQQPAAPAAAAAKK